MVSLKGENILDGYYREVNIKILEDKDKKYNILINKQKRYALEGYVSYKFEGDLYNFIILKDNIEYEISKIRKGE